MNQYKNSEQEIKKYVEGDLSININKIFVNIGSTSIERQDFYKKNGLNFILTRNTLILILENYVKGKYSKDKLRQWGRWIFNFLPIEYKDDDTMIAEVVEILYCIGEPCEGELTKKKLLNLIKRLSEEPIRTKYG